MLDFLVQKALNELQPRTKVYGLNILSHVTGWPWKPQGRQKRTELMPIRALNFADSKVETRRGLMLEPNLCH